MIRDLAMQLLDSGNTLSGINWRLSPAPVQLPTGWVADELDARWRVESESDDYPTTRIMTRPEAQEYVVSQMLDNNIWEVAA